MNRIIQHVIVAALLITPGLAQAELQRYVLSYGDEIYSGKKSRPVLIHLKQELKNQYPEIDFSHMRLDKVTAMAKSRKGHGTLRLRVNKKITGPRNVQGHPGGFHDRSRFTFSKVALRNPASSSSGAWQLQLRGKIKLRKIVVVTENIYHHRHPHQFSRGTSYHRQTGYPVTQWQPDTTTRVRSINLPVKSWGTSLESERGCNQQSTNIRDGWDYPHSLCRPDSAAIYRAGDYSNQLFVRADTGYLGSGWQQGRIHHLDLSLHLTGNAISGNTAATLGITIGGRTYSKGIKLRHHQNRSGHRFALTIDGNWSAADLRRAKFWITPAGNSQGFNVTGLKIRVKEVS